MLSIYQNPVWDRQTIRQDFPNSCHKDTESILLRFQSLEQSGQSFLEDIQCNDTEEYVLFPEARSIIMWLMARVQGTQLGRCVIVKLPPGGVVEPHKDEGASAEFYKRYHVVLQADPGVRFTCEDETVEMVTGQVWWFDNEKTHFVRNESGSDRIHLVIDIKS